jgi:GAF domain-containing protein
MATHIILDEIESLAGKAPNRESFLSETARFINRHFPHYNWVGFYFLEGDKLQVGPYVGKPTPHTVIDLHQGVCGAAVSQGETIVVDDVNADPRYLACSLETRSEIVVPIRIKGKIVGELDIDSDRLAAFTVKDKALMEAIADLVGKTLSRLKDLSGAG